MHCRWKLKYHKLAKSRSRLLLSYEYVCVHVCMFVSCVSYVFIRVCVCVRVCTCVRAPALVCLCMRVRVLFLYCILIPFNLICWNQGVIQFFEAKGLRYDDYYHKVLQPKTYHGLTILYTSIHISTCMFRTTSAMEKFIVLSRIGKLEIFLVLLSM